MIKELKEENLRIEENAISHVKNLHIGYSKEEFLLGFNEENGAFEKAFVLQADKLQEIVALLFQAGVEFQKDNRIDIGFGVGDDDDENTEEND